MSELKSLALVLAVAMALAAGSTAVSAKPVDKGDTPGNGYGKGGRDKGTVVGVPGPIAGIGLPILGVAGGYVWVKARRRRPLSAEE